MLLFLLAAGIPFYAQSPQWAKQMQGPYGATVFSMVNDPSGNIYTSCSFAQSMSVGTQTMYGGGYTDICILKYDPNGTLLWYKVISGGYWHYGNSLCCDAQGNIYLSGSYSGNALFGTTVHASFGSYDAFILKMDPATGNIVWSKHMGGSGDDGAVSMSCDASGNLYAFGTFEATATFGSFTLTASGASDLFVSKIDASNGTVLWSSKMGGSSADNASAMAYTGSGNLYITGSFSNTTTFGTNTFTSAGDLDMYIAALSPATGSVQWAQQIGGTGSDIGQSITADAQGNVYTSGDYQGIISYGSTTLTSLALIRSVCYFKNNGSTGASLFAKSLDGTGPNGYGYAIHCSSAGKIYLSGGFEGSLVVGSNTLTSQGLADIYLIEVDASGNVVWADRKGSIGSDIAYTVYTDAAGNIFTGGIFSGTVLYGPSTLVSPAGTAGFIAKWSGVITAVQKEVMENQNNWILFPSPFTQELRCLIHTNENMFYTLELKDLLGRIVYKTTSNASSIVINTSGLSQGVYEVSLSRGNGFYAVKKIVKQ